jgi:hypothetical protein
MVDDRKVISKKQYDSPKLLIYGDLTAMTTSGGPKGQSDNPKAMSMT